MRVRLLPPLGRIVLALVPIMVGGSAIRDRCRQDQIAPRLMPRRPRWLKGVPLPDGVGRPEYDRR